MNPVPGSTYAIRSEPYDGWTKIGMTGGPHAHHRVRGCQTGNPRRLVLAAHWLDNVESEMHSHFAELRGSGEWFALPLPLIDTMVAVAHEPRPFIALAREWSVERVWAMAGGREFAKDPEGAARVFMSRAGHYGPLDRQGSGEVVDLFDANRRRVA